MRYFMAGLAGLMVLAAPLRAQQDLALLGNGTAVGATAGAMAGRGESLASLTLHVLGIRARGVTAAFSLAVPPKAWGNGAVILGPDLGAAYNVALPNATVLLKGGASALVGMGQGGGAAFPGIHLGVTLLGRMGVHTAVLLDVTEHVYWGYGARASLLCVGIGFAALPRQAR